MLIIPHHDCFPRISAGVFLAPSSTVIGEVEIGADSSVWFNAVVRGDVNRVIIGCRTNIQDGAVVHVTNATHPTVLGDDVTIGHNAVVHGCTVENGCLLGMQSCVLDGVVIGECSLVAAGAVVAPGTHVPPGSLVVGAPARVKRQLSDREREGLLASARNYVQYVRDYPSEMRYTPLEAS